jgi:hypothetical protein
MPVRWWLRRIVRRSRRIASGGAVEFSSGPPAGPHALLAHPAEDPIVHFLTSTAPARSCPLRRHRGPMPRNRPNSGHSRFATGLQHPTPNIPDMGKKQLAVAMTTMSVAALGGGIGVAGAQAQNDETLSGTATTSGGHPDSARLARCLRPRTRMSPGGPPDPTPATSPRPTRPPASRGAPVKRN